MAYSVDATFEKNEKSNRWLALAGVIFFLKWLLLIPHFLILLVLGFVWGLLVWVGYIIVLFTGKYPDWLHTYSAGFLRWTVRTGAWFVGNVDAYPPFTFDEGGYAADASFEYNDNPNRWLAAAGIIPWIKQLLLIPHFIVLYLLGIAMFFAVWVGFLIALFTGKLPDGLQDFFGGVIRWSTRVQAWYAGMVDEYPPFSLQ